MSSQPEHAVVLLGAGSSVDAGCPVMRRFIDRAIDFRRSGRFDEDENLSVEATLNFYDSLRRELAITEPDIENIENLLSLAEVYRLLVSARVNVAIHPSLTTDIRRFIVATIMKSVSLPSPTSADWIGLSGPMSHYKYLSAALSLSWN
jgi:hypothetical protein